MWDNGPAQELSFIKRNSVPELKEMPYTAKARWSHSDHSSGNDDDLGRINNIFRSYAI